MKRSIKLLLRTAVAIAMSISLSSHAMATTLYATGGGSGPGAGISALYTVDPSNGASSLLWNFPDTYVYAGGLAYDAPTDTLYATGAENSSPGTSRLYTINQYTGATTAFGGLSSNINLTSGGLAINPVTGVMYATGAVGDPNPNVSHQSTGLLTIDKNTGAATLAGTAVPATSASC